MKVTIFLLLVCHSLSDPLQSRVLVQLTSSELKDALELWSGGGYRPIRVSGEDGRYAVILERRRGPEWRVRLGLSADEHQEAFDRLTDDGFRPVQVSVFADGEEPRFASIYEKDEDAPDWQSRSGLTPDRYQEEYDKWTDRDYRLRDVGGYTLDGRDYYTGIWEQKEGPPQAARHGLSSNEFPSENKRLENLGYRLLHVSCHSDRFAAIWEKSEGPASQVRIGLKGARAYKDESERLYYQGYRPVWVDSCLDDGDEYYVGIWTSDDPFDPDDMRKVDELVATYMKDQNVPGLYFAIARKGKLKLAKTYRKADDDVQVAPRHRFRIASISKPLTAITVMRLVEEGKLRLSDRIFGRGALLGTAFGTNYSERVGRVTVDHLLTHTVGGWGNKDRDPMFISRSWDFQRLVEYTLAELPLAHEPGTNYEYSNFGYYLLGRIVEVVSGRSYEDYVKEDVLKPIGVRNMRVGGSTLADRLSNKVRYYDPDPERPYKMNISRMAANGGWVGSPVDLVRLLVAVDGFPEPRDILGSRTRDTMLTPHKNSKSYARGWSVNRRGDYWHTGGIAGTMGRVVAAGNYAWAALANTRAEERMNKLMWDVKKAIRRWPQHDLF